MIDTHHLMQKAFPSNFQLYQLRKATFWCQRKLHATPEHNNYPHTLLCDLHASASFTLSVHSSPSVPQTCSTFKFFPSNLNIFRSIKFNLIVLNQALIECHIFPWYCMILTSRQPNQTIKSAPEQIQCERIK